MFDLARDGSIARLTLSRPPVNALSSDMLAALSVALDNLMTGDDPPIVLWLRSDQKHFCAGADLAQMNTYFSREDGADAMDSYTREFHDVFDRLEALPCVTIAEINGAALGGGLEITLACDLRVAGEQARLGLPEASIGLIPAAGGTQRLTRLCGPGVAGRIILSGDVVDGREAERLGLVNWVFPNDRLQSETQAIVNRIAGLSGPALAAAKDCMRAWFDPARDGFQVELEQPPQLLKTWEARERIAAFLNRSK